MTKKERAKLRTEIRRCISELQKNGRMTTRELTQTVIERYPELIEGAKDMLLRDAISGWARQMMKSESKNLKSPQFRLPLEVQGVKLPQSISIPPSNDEDNDDTLWLPIEEATFEDLERHIEMLRASVTANLNRLQNFDRLYRYLAPIMSDDMRDEAIGPVLSEAARSEKAA